MSGNRRVLVVDDEPGFRAMLAEIAADMGCLVDAAADGREALAKAAASDYDLAILDLSLPKLSGVDVLAEIKRRSPDTAVIMVTGYATAESAVEAMKLGAYDYIAKPFNVDEVRMIAERALERGRLIDENRFLREELRQRFGFDNVIGSNPQVQKAHVLAAQVAQTNATVLLLGETGTGKEFLARFIHYHSKRSQAPFVKVNCAALPETLLESELFGHEKGAFTGAVGRRIGRFEMADGGAIFLDEIGDVSPAVQLRLLRVLQEKQFERVGGSETIEVDTRIIAATNRDLVEAMAQKSFREDLFYRINVITINLPPLRERREDLPVFVEHFIARHSAEMGKKVNSISPDAMQMLIDYDWPGNIRELSNCIERAVILTRGDTITPRDLSFFSHVREGRSAPAACPPAAEPCHQGADAELLPLYEVERRHIEKVLRAVEWHQTKAASILGIDRKTLRNKTREFGLTRD